MSQRVITGLGSSEAVAELLRDTGAGKFLLVSGRTYRNLDVRPVLESLPIPHVRFSDFASNPLYEQVCAGVDLFRREACDAIVAIGGGSAMDVAKCIKLYCRSDAARNYLEQPMTDTGVPLIAIPTTAGTGSESTRHAVIYYDGKKQSISHTSIIPDWAILDARVLKTLPLYQKKCAMLDALCQGIESWWAVDSTDESKGYARQAVGLVMQNWSEYIRQDSEAAAERILLAANCSGRAINITATTAAHAMSYKLTSMYHLPHGHAVAVCLPRVWRYMSEHLDGCIDGRGAAYLKGVFDAVSREMGCGSVAEAIALFESLLRALELRDPDRAGDADLDILAASVNPTRLKNNPVKLDEATLRSLYRVITE